ncbi:MAG TPA: polyprenol monophosphomannose synthase [Nocardioidaceae bacterium]|nr:polyprenol monophosphomannose synthase [Nocardioidaceae bacterium]
MTDLGPVSGPAAGPVLVVIPTYDEVDNVEPVVRGVRAAAPAADVLVVDDGSPDGTGDRADVLAAADPQVHVLHRRDKAGLGAAYRAGFDWGLARGYQVLVEMDADLSHQPGQLPAVLAGLDTGADLSLGSRWVPGGAVRNWPRHRRWLSRAGNVYVRLMLGVPVRDATGGFRALRRGTLEVIGIDRVASQGYCFQVDVVRRVFAAGLSTVEVPIEFVERERGYSKMDAAIVAEALWRVSAWGTSRLATELVTRARSGLSRHQER